jgi:hypothetical protein
MSSTSVEPENAIVSDSLDAMEIQLNDGNGTIRKNVRRVAKSADDLKDYLLTKYPNGFGLDNMLDVVIECIQYLATYRNMSGFQKRQLIIDSMLLLLDETNSGEMELYEPIVKAMIPSTINTLVDVEKKKIKLNKKVRKCCCLC